jgi:hypothetical protein
VSDKKYKEVRGRIYIWDKNGHAGSVATRTGASEIPVGYQEAPVSPTIELDPTVWGDDVASAHALYLKAKAEAGQIVIPSTETRVARIVNGVVNPAEGRPTLLPGENRVYLGYIVEDGKNLSVYLRTDGRVAVSKPEINEATREPVFNEETNRPKFTLSELDYYEYEEWIQPAIKVAKKAWENKALKDSGALPSGVFTLTPDYSNFNSNRLGRAIVNDSAEARSEQYHIIDANGDVRIYIALDENGECVELEDTVSLYDTEIEYYTLGNIKDPEIASLYRESQNGLDRLSKSLWYERDRDPYALSNKLNQVRYGSATERVLDI